MEDLICLFGKWYSKKELSYKTWTTNSIIEYNTDTSAEHPIKDGDIVRYSNENQRSLG